MRRLPFSVIGLLVLTLVVRVGVLLVTPGALAGDPDGYRRLAENLVEHGTLGEGTQPTAYRPPLYPLVLAPCVALGDRAESVAIGTLHVLLGLGTVWLVWRIGHKCGLGRWALLAGALVACDPILLGQSTVVMTETLAAFLVAMTLLALIRAGEMLSLRRAALAGASLGLCGLCRPELLLWATACAAAMFLIPKPSHGHSHPSRDRKGAESPPSAETEKLTARPPNRSLTVAARFDNTVAARFFLCAAMLAGLVAVLVPWVVRNQIQFGRPIVATTHGGYTLLLANNPSFYEFLRDGKSGTVWDARGLGPVWGGKAHHDSPAAELAADREAYALAWQNIRREPGMFAWSCVVRAGRFWALAPHQGSAAARRAIGAWYLIEFVLAAVGILFHHRGTEDTEGPSEKASCPSQCPPCLCGEPSCLRLFGPLLAVSMTAVHAVFWSDMRMRGPLVPVIALAAAAGIAWLRDRVRASQPVAA